MIDQGCTDSGDFVTALNSLYDEIKAFCQTHSVPLHMTGLTRTLLSFPRDFAYPTGPAELHELFCLLPKPSKPILGYPDFFDTHGCYVVIYFVVYCFYPRSWFKGADTHAVLKFLEYKIPLLDNTGAWELYKTCIYEAVKAGNMFLSILYRNGLWLKPSAASAAAHAGMDFCLRYRECSELAWRANKTRFKLPPKFHAYVHIVHGVIEQLGKLPGDVLNADLPSVFNPLAQSCQMDEDMVGHIASLSRSSVPKSVHEKTIGVYLMNLQAKW